MVRSVMRKDKSRPVARSASARKIRVVLVDDSALSMKFLIHLLETFPRVQIAGQAEDGLDGFALTARLQPDLVLTDLQMPGRDGLELVKLLRQAYPAIRLIITLGSRRPPLPCGKPPAWRGRLYQQRVSVRRVTKPP